MEKTDVVIIGAGAAGLMCAAAASRRRRKVVVLDHSGRPGNKILVSGGGRCNFTNYHVDAGCYLSGNPHFCKSALSRFSQWDFLERVKTYEIPFHEREHGQLFCDGSAREILDMLLTECRIGDVSIRLKAVIHSIEKLGGRHYAVRSGRGDFHCESLVIATGGLSVPSLGASPFGYKIAEQFGLKVRPIRPALVPLTLNPADKERFSALSGIAVDANVRFRDQSFRGNLLFTHRGLSGPAVLQISSYWEPGGVVAIDLLPGMDLGETLEKWKEVRPKIYFRTALSERLPKRLVDAVSGERFSEVMLRRLDRRMMEEAAMLFHKWRIKPGGTEGYRTAEVTAGGVDCDGISSKTMEARDVEGLFFVGEVLDVTGRLGGYNLQWAWSSGWCAGQYA